jgi:hypothetical protein
MIGASYDDVEMFLRLRELGREPSATIATAIERLHRTNRHKYVVAGSAVHVDVLPRGVPDGWLDDTFAARSERRPPREALPGAWDPPASLALDPLGECPLWERLILPFDEAFAVRVRGALTAADCERLQEAALQCGAAEPVGVTGIRDGYGVGSMRSTAWSPDLAMALFARVRPAIPAVRFLGERCFTDAFATSTRPGHERWRVVGLTPVLRFMRYAASGRHLCHYDAGYDYGDGRRTLLSVVFYLTDAADSGATRFVRDGQELLPVHARSFADWDRDTREGEVLVRVQPARGDVLVFDHRLCHDVERWDGPGERMIVRADVVYEAIPPSAWRRS